MKKPPRDWLHYEYVVRKRGVFELAESIECSSNTVRKYLTEVGIPLRSIGESISEGQKHRYKRERGDTVLDNPEELKRWYEDQELSPREIADRIGVSSSCVKRHLEEYRIPLRDLSSSQLTSRAAKKRQGPKSRFWKGGRGGRAPGFSKGLKKRVRARDGNQCRICGTNCDLVVHHKNFDGDDHRFENLTTLCRSCHSIVHAHQIHVKIESSEETEMSNLLSVTFSVRISEENQEIEGNAKQTIQLPERELVRLKPLLLESLIQEAFDDYHRALEVVVQSKIEGS